MTLRRLSVAAILLSAMLPLAAHADKLPLPRASGAHVHDAAPPYSVRYSRSGKRYFASKGYYGVRPRPVHHTFGTATTPVRSHAPRRPSYRYGYRAHRQAYHHRYQHRYGGFASYPPAFRPGLVALLSGGMSSRGYAYRHHGYGGGRHHGYARYSYGDRCAC